MQPLPQATIVSVGAGLTTAWWLAIRTHSLGEALGISALCILAGAVAIALYEYFAWKRRFGSSDRRIARQRELISALRTMSLAAITPLLEKNAIKVLTTDVPIVFSMSRVVVLAFAVGMMRQLWGVGIAGWPEATLAISIVLALPILGALERATPEQLVDVTRTLIGRLGVGEARLGAPQAESVS